MLQARERTPTPSPSNVFTFGLAIESIKELGGASLWLLLPAHFSRLNHKEWKEECNILGQNY
jgi:hypothetical protein